MNKIFIILFLLVFSAIGCAGMIENTCWAENSENNYKINLRGGKFTSSKAGAEAKFTADNIPFYKFTCWVSVKNPAPSFSPLVSYMTETDYPPSEYGQGFIKLNEDVDARIELFQVGQQVVPDNTGTNHDDFMSYSVLPPVNRVYSGNRTGFGAVGRTEITLRLRRDQLGGGLRIPMGQLFRGYAALSIPGETTLPNRTKNDTPVISVSTVGEYIPLPIVCRINNGMAIEVDFGDLDNTHVRRDGGSYIKNVPLKYQCDSSVTQNININLVATPASFSSDVIASNLPEDIGVMVKYNGALVKPNGSFDTVLVNGIGQDQLHVSPVINDMAKSVTGNFTASATLIMTVK